VLIAAVLDLALVLLFVVIGRRSHDEGDSLLGLAITAWPFVAGAVVGWSASLAWRRPFAVWPTGIVVWAGAVVLGMLLRVVSGQGVQPSFVIVTVVVVGAFLIGWRAVAAAVRRMRRRSGASARRAG
jgi:ABC-type Fe3+ transport system permease subunit